MRLGLRLALDSLEILSLRMGQQLQPSRTGPLVVVPNYINGKQATVARNRMMTWRKAKPTKGLYMGRFLRLSRMDSNQNKKKSFRYKAGPIEGTDGPRAQDQKHPAIHSKSAQR